jgi:tetratricopeptide (TPR) repeat protein
MIDKTLGNRYKIIGKLGDGGMAWVYLAEDLLEGRRVAVKVLYPQLSQDVGFVQRFTQEAKLAMGLFRPLRQTHIVRVLDYGSDRDVHYLVMEHVEGRDLRHTLNEDGPLPWQDALDIARQVALALEHAHQHGIIHRDIKPENIMILPDGVVQVLDFGVARARTSPSLTYSGFVGSPYYVAPEQAMGRSVDIRADLYSLGIVLYEMLCGEPPFRSDTPWVIINHHIATPPTLPEEVCPDLPRTVARLLRRGMAKRPEDRFQTPTELVQAIEGVLSGLDVPLESQDAEPDVLVTMLAGLYDQAQQAVQAKDWQEAVDLFSQILRFDPRYRDVVDQLAEAGRQARLAALYAAARRALQAEYWAEALVQLDEMAQIAPDYRDVQELQAQARYKHELDQLYRQGIQHLDAGEWGAAIDRLAQVQAQDANYARVAELLASARAEQEKARGEDAASVEKERAEREPARRRSLLWALVALLVVALAVESYFFYRAVRPPVIVSAPGTAPAPADATSVLLPPPSLMALSTFTATLAPTTRQPPDPTIPVVPPLSPTATATSTAQSPVAVRPRLAGQIAFPRFDPARGTYDVWVCRVDGSNCRLVAAEASQPDFLPDGAQLVLHSWKADEKGLVLQTLSGERIWRISDGFEAARPCVDFEGKLYVYHSRQEADRQPRLYRTHNSETRPVVREANVILGLSPSWLPDGRILYSGCLGDACGILVMAADGTNPRQVAAGGNETNPEASPNGRQVAFMSQRDHNWEVYVINLDGTGLRRLTRSPGNDGLPAWSPDGRYIAFVSDRDGVWAVWVMRPDGGDLRRLFDVGGPLEGQVQHAAPHEIHGWVEERISWGRLP